MRVLIADDDPMSLAMLKDALRDWGHDVSMASNGLQAWTALQQADSPPLVIVDWMMPALDGVELCRRVRATTAGQAKYILLLTSREAKDDIVTALQAGANDYVTKPFHEAELHARLQVGARVIQLQADLAKRVHELENALAEVKQLSGLLPICSYCKKIRDDRNYWQQVDSYVSQHTGVCFSHGICPQCWEGTVKPQFQEKGITLPDYPQST